MTKFRVATLSALVAAFSCLAAQAQLDTSYGTGACNSGSSNSAFGFGALTSCTSQANENTAVGEVALYNSTSGSVNTAVGAAALTHDTTGSNNVAVGVATLSDITTGSWNTAVGEAALVAATTGTNNVAVGYSSLLNIVIGSNNIALGEIAGANINYNSQTNGPASNTANYSNNIEIGNQGGSTDNSVIRIGTPGTQTQFFAAGVYGTNISGVPVEVNSTGQLGIASSSIRYKQDVHDMDEASSGLFRLRPVTYRYKQAYADGSRPVDYGLIAEEVAAVYPDLVSRNADGEIQTVRYQKLTPMLLNELQKQHGVLEHQAEQLKQQSEQINDLKRMNVTMERQVATVQLLEKRLAALEATQATTSSTLEANLTR